MNPKNPNRGRTLALTGAIFQLGPLVGLAWTAEGMRRTLAVLEGTEGIGDPGRVSAAIGEVLVGLLIGLSLGVVGLVLLFVALMGCRYRAKWFFWFLVIYGVLALPAFPVGTVLGVVLLVYCHRRRHEFLRSDLTGA